MTHQAGPSPGNGPESIQSILVLRKVTRAVADALRPQLLDYLATLTPLYRPKAILGDYIQSGAKEPARRADKAFKELQALYESVAATKPFNLPRELKPPIDVSSVNLELTPLEYHHEAEANGERRTLTVRSPLTWILTYSGFAPTRFRELLDTKGRSNDEVQKFVLAYLALHVVVSNQPGVTQMLDALRFHVSSAALPGFGELPVTRIAVPIATVRASDQVMLQSAELTGMDAFEEVVKVDDITRLRDDFRDRLLEVVRTQAPELTAPGVGEPR